jgi:hypothetical protein
MYERKAKWTIENETQFEIRNGFELYYEGNRIWPIHGKEGVYVCLEGSFNPDELEAIAWWMRNKKPD